MSDDTARYAGSGIHPERVAQTEDKDARILKYLRQDYDTFHERVIGRLDGFPDPEEHWLWTGSMHESGYGVHWLPKKYGGDAAKVHRMMAIWKYGSIPPHMVLDHDANGCPRHCANPVHLEVTSQYDNWTRQRQRQTHCKRGHPLSGDNIYEHRQGRSCKTCMREAANRQYAGIKEAAKVLGLPVTEYMKRFGKSGEQALALIEQHRSTDG